MPTIEEVKNYLATRGIEIMEFAAPTPTAEAAARAVGCPVGKIAKTVLLVVGGQPLVVVASGDVKVKSSLLKKAVGLTGKVRFPAADEVLRCTGYAPGGVSPFLLPPELPVLLDVSLRRFSVVYPAAGNNYSAVPVTVGWLLELTSGREVCVCS